jgi:hypothetical protein
VKKSPETSGRQVHNLRRQSLILLTAAIQGLKGLNMPVTNLAGAVKGLGASIVSPTVIIVGPTITISTMGGLISIILPTTVAVTGHGCNKANGKAQDGLVIVSAAAHQVHLIV